MVKAQEQSQIIKLPKPISYQKEIIDWMGKDDVKYVAFTKGRQQGNSFLFKMLVIKWLMENKNVKVGYVVPTYKLGKLFYKELIKYIQPFIKKENSTDLYIEVITGSNVQFFSAESGDSIRGFQFHYLLLDECAFMSDDVWNYIIKPTIMIIGRKIIMGSTPNGNQGFFYQHINYGLDKVKGYKTKMVNVYDNPFISKEDIEIIKQQIPDKIFRQEYLGEFLDGAGSVFSNYNNCIVSNPKKTQKVVAGIDWGKKNDATVLTIMSLDTIPCILERLRIQEMDYTMQVKLIVNKLNQYKPIQTISEENSIGTVVNEMLRKEYKGNLKCITLDNSLKREIIENLIVAFETETIGILPEDDLLREIQSFTCTYNPSTSTIKYGARTGMHDDSVISLAYAYYLTKHNKTEYGLRFV